MEMSVYQFYNNTVSQNTCCITGWINDRQQIVMIYTQSFLDFLLREQHYC